MIENLVILTLRLHFHCWDRYSPTWDLWDRYSAMGPLYSYGSAIFLWDRYTTPEPKFFSEVLYTIRFISFYSIKNTV